MPNRVQHFEIPANDTDRCKKFYEELFGWTFEKMPMEGMDYWAVMTADKESTEPGINGGMYKRDTEYTAGTNQVTTNYVSVDNCQSYADKAVSLGATVSVEKTDVGGMGWFIIIKDTEENMVGLWQDIPKTE